MISKCSQRPCRKKIAGIWRGASPFVSRPGSQRQRSWGARARLAEVIFVEDPRKDHGVRTAARMHPARPRGSSASLPGLGTHSCPVQPQRGEFPHIREAALGCWAEPGQQGSRWSWQTKNNAPGKNKARGSLEKLHSEEPLPPSTNFSVQYQILSLCRENTMANSLSLNSLWFDIPRKLFLSFPTMSSHCISYPVASESVFQDSSEEQHRQPQDPV